jgi:hypothetical protein
LDISKLHISKLDFSKHEISKNELQIGHAQNITQYTCATFSLQNHSLQRFSLRNLHYTVDLHCTAEPSLHCGTFTAEPLTAETMLHSSTAEISLLGLHSFVYCPPTLLFWRKFAAA